MEMKLINKSSKDIDKVKNLYFSAFPEDEREPFHVLINSEFPNSKLFGFYDDDKFIGLTFVCFYKDLIYIVYLAVDTSERNKHYGSKILAKLSEEFNDKTFILSVEKPEQEGDIASRRLNHFYKGNGFSVVGFEFTHKNVRFVLMYKGKFNETEFKECLLHLFPASTDFSKTDIK